MPGYRQDLQDPNGHGVYCEVHGELAQMIERHTKKGRPLGATGFVENLGV
ncbi:hypothetical protein [Marinobacterium aestuariivivens]|uniref:Uncharacterized protein n=1 Tax=Marinobacterium aestuariivivens TaxID=1698799 RepID=A0ABW2A6U9_9GAMM